jgi:uncharacterized membrane protein YhaH (DUF805 family)
MTFQESIRACLANYADFSGRASRPECWWFLLFLVIGIVACSRVDDRLTELFVLAMLLPTLSVAARRLRDGGYRPWWLLLAVVPMAGWLALLVLLLQGRTSGCPGSPDDGRCAAR